MKLFVALQSFETAYDYRNHVESVFVLRGSVFYVNDESDLPLPITSTSYYWADYWKEIETKEIL